MDTAFHRGWLVASEQRVQCGNEFNFDCYMVHLEAVLLCEALGDLTVSIGQFHYQILTLFCSMHVRLLHCKMRVYSTFCCGKLCALVL